MALSLHEGIDERRGMVAELDYYCEMPAQSGAAFVLRKGQVLKVQSPHAKQVSDLFCVNFHDRAEVLSTGRTLDYNDSLYITTGQSLYSNRSSVMLSIIDDHCGRHDLLMTPCSLKMFQIVANNEDYHPSCHENLAKNLAEFSISEDHIGGTFNIFMNVQVDLNGKVQIHPPTVQAGDMISFRAEMDLLVGLTACSHEETNDGVCKSMRYRVET